MRRLLRAAAVAMALAPFARADEPVPFTAHRLNTFRSEALTVADFNADGRLDIAAGAFLYLAPDFKPSKIRTLEGNVDDQGKGYHDDFANLPLDVDGDGRLDLVSAGWFCKCLRWHRNTLGQPGEWPEAVVDTAGNFEGAELADLDGDGQAREILADTAVTAWYELGKAADGRPGLVRHVVSEEPVNFGVGCGDVNADGRPDLLRPDAWFEAPSDLRDGSWVKHPWALGAPGGKADHTPQILLFDVNADGRVDVVTSSAHKYGIFWYEQAGDPKAPTWTQHTIDDTWTQAHTLSLVDLDGDGVPELVTGKRFMAHNGGDPDETGALGVYYYRLARGPEPSWSRHAISHDHGIGSGVSLWTGDLDADGDADVVVTGKYGGPVWFENRRIAR